MEISINRRFGIFTTSLDKLQKYFVVFNFYGTQSIAKYRENYATRNSFFLWYTSTYRSLFKSPFRENYQRYPYEMFTVSFKDYFLSVATFVLVDFTVDSEIFA